MAAALQLIVPVEAGELAMSDGQRATIRNYLKLFDSRTVAVRLSKPTIARSLNQNSYYWGVVLTTIATETGNSTEDVHIAVKDMFLPRKFVKLGNREINIRKTTVDLTTAEFTQYIEQIRVWASSELGLNLPEPN